MEKMQVLVVIPTLNEAEHIEATIVALHQAIPDKADILFVVVDGGSTDGTQAIVQQLKDCNFPNLRLLHNPKRLQSAAVNLAVRQFGAPYKVLVRCDAHSVYPPGFIRDLVASLDEHVADAVVVPMDSIGDTPLRKAIAWVSDTPVGSGGSAHRGGRQSGFVDHGHHAAFRMASFCRAGGYDESFSHNEDAELDCRQRALGSRIFLDANIRIGYYARPTLRSLWKQYSAYGSGRSRTVRRHPGSLRARQLAVPVHVALSTGALVAAPWVPWLLAWPLLYLAVLLGTSAALGIKHRNLAAALAAPAAFVMHTAWAIGFFRGMLAFREEAWTEKNAEPLALSGSSVAGGA
ncbi:glycosyltransferase family 2 protein [uncultured Aquabacterium sp.]|uniref:glycosyltransferase family 2 protein n=1 Tax=uncultured Aquabacterium sp. TaxID=158753 RepID=UPI0025EC2E15|nr:glycosyltransferase family 2 protein [uncultured Aquabacterium sp.]